MQILMTQRWWSAGIIVGAVCVGAILAVMFDTATVSVPIPDDLSKLHTMLQTEAVPVWQTIIATQGPVSAYELLDTINQGRDLGTQHTQAHYFGEALYKTEGISGVAICDSRFGFGCYHSFFGFALVDRGLSILTELDEACIAVHGEKGLGCQHGIGHGVLVELGDTELEEALVACRTLQWQGDVGGCTSGVFMEYNFSTMNEEGVRPLEPGTEYEPCIGLPDVFKPACYFEQPAWWIAISNFDYAYAGELCDMVDQAANRRYCYMGLGNTVAGTEQMAFDSIKEACRVMPNAEGHLNCIEGAAWITSAQPQYDGLWEQLCDPFVGAQYEQCLASRDFI